MDELRIALLVLGIVVVVGVYFTTRRKTAAPLRNSEPGGRVEPSFDAEPLNDPQLGTDSASDHDRALPEMRAMNAEPLVAPTLSPDEMPEASDASPERDSAPAPDIPEKVISLRIVKKDGGLFGAEPVILKLRSSGMQHGRFGIFHYLAADTDDDAMFSAASLTEPGSFDLQKVKDAELAGLSIFMLRPGPGRGVDAFDKMIEVARAVSISLEGELLDGDGSTLSIQRERFLREELIQYELQHLKLS
ncbi:MAG: cell division protein ZipA C-terminal FtsZ-binding domain-containing protein [Pseudomonadota bacterium]